MNKRSEVNRESVKISAGPRLRTAMILAIVADTLQLVVFPLFVQGAMSPADDLLDLAIGAVLSYLLGWHWEFLPSFLAKLVPGVDLVPLWTLAVANVYRKSKQIAVSMEGVRGGEPTPRAPGS
ncbi:MAG: hypothetical protein WA802_09180 [Terracidiphilus sp.]